MKPSTPDNTITRKKRPEEPGTLVGVRLQSDDLAKLDGFIRSQPSPITRPEAIRRLLTGALGEVPDAGSIPAEDLNASNDE
jgi:hypothetical protein